MQVHVLHTFAYVSAASSASLAATNPSMKGSTKGGRHPLWRRREAPPPSWMDSWRPRRQQTQQKRMQMCAKYALACTLYEKRLIHMGICLAGRGEAYRLAYRCRLAVSLTVVLSSNPPIVFLLRCVGFRASTIPEHAKHVNKFTWNA